MPGDSVDVVEPTTNNPMLEISKILYRLKWCEDKIKDGNHLSDFNINYLTNRVRDLEGFLAVMDGERVKEVSRKYFDKRDKERLPSTPKKVKKVSKKKVLASQHRVHSTTSKSA